MDSFELNKIVGAILVTALTVTVIGHVGDILVPTEPAGHGEAAHVDAAGGADGAGAPAEDTVAPLPVRLADASAEDGENVSKRCLSCHSFEEGGPNKVGPNLHGIVGRPKGSVQDFNYSPGMAEIGGEWEYAALDEFLSNPQGYVSGTKMTFRLRDPEDRADVIAYLKSISPDAPPFPEPEPQQAEAGGEGGEPAAEGEAQDGGGQAAEGQDAPQDGGGEQTAAADPMARAFADISAEDGEQVAKRCVACHSFEEGGPNKVGPNLHGIVGRERGSLEGFDRYSAGLTEMGGRWDYASLFEYLENPQDYVDGSKMTFKLRDAEDRANVIAYLKSISPGAPPLPGATE